MEEYIEHAVKNSMVCGPASLLAGLCKDIGFGRPESLISSYGADTLSPIILYFMGRALSPKTSPSRLFLASLAIPALTEVGQALGFYPGVYDSKDFLAYMAGAGVAFLIDKAINRKGGLENKMLNQIEGEKRK